MVRGWRDEEDLNEIEVVGKKSIKITNSKGEYLFTIENKEIQKDILEVKDLYNYEGIQWFETSAEKYHKLLDVNPKLKNKEKCEKLGVLYFTWREIVEFALIDRYSFQYNPYGNGNWKAVENGAKGYILVSMEGIPYWADAVGQIPYAIDIYRKKLSDTKSKDLSRKIVIQKGYEYGNGLPFIGYDDSNSYDNAMILRGVNWAEKNFDIDDAGIKNNNIKASLLRLDSQGRIIHE